MWYEFPIEWGRIVILNSNGEETADIGEIKEIRKDRSNDILLGNYILPFVKLQLDLKVGPVEKYVNKKCRINGVTKDERAFIGYLDEVIQNGGMCTIQGVTYNGDDSSEQ